MYVGGGLSRGVMYEGIMKWELILSYVPPRKGEFEVCPALLEWITSCAVDMGNEVEALTL